MFRDLLFSYRFRRFSVFCFLVQQKVLLFSPFFFFSFLVKEIAGKLSTPSRIDILHQNSLCDDGIDYRNNSPR